MKMFPVMIIKRYWVRCPREIPFALVAAHESQTRKNHYQSVERLAARGGLTPSELMAILEDREWQLMDDQIAIDQLLQYLEEHRVCSGCERPIEVCGSIVEMPDNVKLYLCHECTNTP